MNNLTLIQKQALESLAESGSKIISVAYDPRTGINPEPNILAQGFVEFYREAEADLIEVIYTK